MKFYDCITAPSPRRVRIFLAEKGISLPTVQVDLRNGEQFTDAFRAINPDFTVPVLQLDDGAYLTPISANPETPGMNIRDMVHAMEHGRIEIHYKPSLPEAQQLALKGVFDADPNGMLFFPNPAMPYDVAVTAWTNEVVCPHYNEVVLDVIRNFRDTYRGNGPEQGIPIDLP